MRLFIIFLTILCVTAFASCVDRMDINDVVDGTPSRIDTVVTRNYVPAVKKDSTKKDTPEEEK